MTTRVRNSGVTAPTFHLTDRGQGTVSTSACVRDLVNIEEGLACEQPGYHSQETLGVGMRQVGVERRAVGPDLQSDDPFRIVEVGIEAVRAAAGIRAGGSG